MCSRDSKEVSVAGEKMKIKRMRKIQQRDSEKAPMRQEGDRECNFSETRRKKGFEERGIKTFSSDVKCPGPILFTWASRSPAKQSGHVIA